MVGIRRREPQLLEDVPHVLLDCVIASASAIAALERLSAISPSTSRARAEIGEWARAAAPWLQASPAAEWKSEAPRQWRGSSWQPSNRPAAASNLQAVGFRSDVTVFRLNARRRPKTGSESAFRRRKGGTRAPVEVDARSDEGRERCSCEQAGPAERTEAAVVGHLGELTGVVVAALSAVVNDDWITAPRYSWRTRRSRRRCSSR